MDQGLQLARAMQRKCSSARRGGPVLGGMLATITLAGFLPSAAARGVEIIRPGRHNLEKNPAGPQPPMYRAWRLLHETKGYDGPRRLTVGLLEMEIKPTTAQQDHEPERKLEKHTHPQPEIYGVVEASGEGEAAMWQGDRKIALEQGKLLLIPSDEEHSIVLSGVGRLRLFYVFGVPRMGLVRYHEQPTSFKYAGPGVGGTFHDLEVGRWSFKAENNGDAERGGETVLAVLDGQLHVTGQKPLKPGHIARVLPGQELEVAVRKHAAAFAFHPIPFGLSEPPTELERLFRGPLTK